MFKLKSWRCVDGVSRTRLPLQSRESTAVEMISHSREATQWTLWRKVKIGIFDAQWGKTHCSRNDKSLWRSYSMNPPPPPLMDTHTNTNAHNRAKDFLRDCVWKWNYLYFLCGFRFRIYLENKAEPGMDHVQGTLQIILVIWLLHPPWTFEYLITGVPANSCSRPGRTAKLEREKLNGYEYSIYRATLGYWREGEKDIVPR